MNLNLQHTNWAFTPRYNKVNTKCYSKQYIEIKVKYKKGTKFLSWINAKRPFRNCAQEIILLILTTFCFDYLVILLGENWLWSLLGLNAKTFVWLSGTGRSLHVVRTCKPLTWLVCGTSTFLIIRKKRLSSNYSRIKIHLKSHKCKPHTTSPFNGHFIFFWELHIYY